MEGITANDISFYLESQSIKKNKSILDTIVSYCEDHFLDVEDIVPYLNSTIIGKLESYFVAEGTLTRRSSIEDLLC